MSANSSKPVSAAKSALTNPLAGRLAPHACTSTSFPGSFPRLGVGRPTPKPGKRPWERGWHARGTGLSSRMPYQHRTFKKGFMTLGFSTMSKYHTTHTIDEADRLPISSVVPVASPRATRSGEEWSMCRHTLAQSIAGLNLPVITDRTSRVCLTPAFTDYE